MLYPETSTSRAISTKVWHVRMLSHFHSYHHHHTINGQACHLPPPPTASHHHQQPQTPTTNCMATRVPCHMWIWMLTAVNMCWGALGPSRRCKLSIFIVVFVVFEVLTSFFLLFLGYLLLLQQQCMTHAYALPVQKKKKRDVRGLVEVKRPQGGTRRLR